jgi:hypothetical protein
MGGTDNKNSKSYLVEDQQHATSAENTKKDGGPSLG